MAARPHLLLATLVAAGAVAASSAFVGLPAQARPAATAVGSGTVDAVAAPAIPPLTADDAVPVRQRSDRLAVPRRAAADSSARAYGAQATPRYRYALSFVVIPIKGRKLGFSRARIRALTARVAARMTTQTGNRVSYGFAGWNVAPKVRASKLSCDIYSIHRRYHSYAAHLRRPPRGFRDTIAVYLTPPRYDCDFAGVAMLGGQATYLNGLYPGRQGLQDWITAHELGHNLGLDHSAAFWPATGTWDPAQRVPVNERAQEVADYGDYLDLMGQPPNGGLNLPGANFTRWVFNSLSLVGLGVLRDTNVSYVKRSSTYVLNRLQPAVAGGVMILAIPVDADRESTYWALEFREPAENASSLRYPQPYATRGYGVRLLLVRHGGGLFLNKVFKRNWRPASFVALPAGVPVRLGGGATVTVLGADADRALVTVAVDD